MKKLVGQVRAAIDKYNMINAGDNIAIGISGGKDSIFLLYALATLRGYYPKSFNIVGITVDPCFGGHETDFTSVSALCQELKVPYHIQRTDLSEIIFDIRREKNPCSLCAKMRRGILHNMAVESGCNSIALGHHFDDAATTFFMNLLNGGTLSCFSPVSYLSRRDLQMIRPLIFCEESDIIRIIKKLKLPVVASACPVDGHTERKIVDELVLSLENQYPHLRKKVIGALERAHVDGWGT